MQLCLSNLAYNSETEESVFSVMKENNINAVETVFTKIKPWTFLNKDDVYNYKVKLDKRSLVTRSAQSLFYGLTFTLNDVDLVLEHFGKLIAYSKILGINQLVFGSPNMRKMEINYKQNLTTIFRILDTMLIDTDINVVIEPNARVYGGDFWYTVPEIADFLEDKYLRRIKTMVDYHNSILECRDPCQDLLSHKKYISHIHVSEPKLTSMQNMESHKRFSETIKQIGYSDIITYEILECPNILSTIKDFADTYG